MKKIYFKNAQGKKVAIEVSEEIERQYRESLREEWRSDAYEKYYSKSLERIKESGQDFEDERTDIDEILNQQEKQKEQAALMYKLNAALSNLTDLQQQTIHKLFKLNMSQSEIAREEGVAQQVVNRRVTRIIEQLRKFIKKN